MVMEDKIDNFTRLFPEHQQHWVPAKKTNRSGPGRPSEGSVLGIKNNMLLNAKLLEHSGYTLVELRIREVKYYILPVYLNDSKWQPAFDELKCFLNEVNHENLIIIGDLNARIGRENITGESELLEHLSDNRKSKDTKIDKRGKDLIELCYEYGFNICNGCTKGDEEGELTYINANGGSVIDLGLFRGQWTGKIQKFQVLDINYSDHFPIRLEIVTPVHNRVKMNLLPKMNWNMERVKQYQDKVRTLVATYNNQAEGNINEWYNHLIDTVKLAQIENERKSYANGEKKWYNWKCVEARKLVFSILKKYRKTGQEIYRVLYIEQNRKYKQICRNTKKMYEKNLAKELACAKDTKHFWQIIKKIQDLTPSKGTALTATRLANYFAIQLNPPQPISSLQYAENYVQCDALDEPFRIEELEMLLKKLKDKKAPGADRITYEFFKNAPEEFLEKLLGLYNKILNEANVPDTFRKSVIYPIYKKGNPNEPANYRAIAFTDAAAKIFCGLLTTRLNKFAEERNILSQLQAGFRQGYGTNDHIFTVINTIDLYKIKNKKLYCMFIDFKAAFDHIDRRALIYKLSQLGVSTKFLAVIKSLYTNTSSAVWDGSEVSDEFETISGLKQGCIISPTLFNLFINDIVEILPGGAKIMDLVIKILLYADDLVIFAETPESLQLMINRIKDYCEKWNLTINLEKSKIMVFKKSTKMAKNEKWYWGAESINTVTEYKYLGITITPQINIKKHCEGKYKQAVRTLGATWGKFMENREIATSAKYRIFQSVIRSVICYGAQTWGYKEYEEVEKVQKYFLKRLFKLPINTPDYMLYVESGLAPLYLHTLKLHADYISRVMTYEADRIPRKLAEIILGKKALYIRKWMDLAEENNLEISLTLENVKTWKAQIYDLIAKTDAKLYKENLHKAQNSNYRNVYIHLNHKLGVNSYFQDKYSTSVIGNIFKVRGELLKLNYRPHIETNTTQCTLCNLKRMENTMHFVGECPILKEIRIVHFGKGYLNQQETYEYLNGKDWRKLADYVMEAMSYRNAIIREE